MSVNVQIPVPTAAESAIGGVLSPIYTALTQKQRVFVESYLVTLDPAKACEAAGYDAKNLKNLGNKLLAKPYIALAVETSMQQRLARIRVSQDMVINELAKIGFADMGTYLTKTDTGVAINFDADNPDHTVAVKKVKVQQSGAVEFELHDKMAALRLLNDHFGSGDGSGDDIPNGEAIEFSGFEIVGVESGTYLPPDDGEIIEGEIIPFEELEQDVEPNRS